MAQVRRIGLTGGIATGKSSVARCLAERHGIPVLDADQFAREALAPGTEATTAVLRRYGARVQAVGSQNGQPSLDRSALGRIVFADPGERHWLEQLVHPLVRHRFAAALPQLQSVPVVVLMVPLLFESGLDSLCSEIWVVDCGTEDEQLRRLLARDPISLQEARERLRSQWPMEAKRSRATVVIDNSGPLSGLMAQVDQALASPGAAVACVSADNPPAASPAAPGAPPAV